MPCHLGYHLKEIVICMTRSSHTAMRNFVILHVHCLPCQDQTELLVQLLQTVQFVIGQVLLIKYQLHTGQFPLSTDQLLLFVHQSLILLQLREYVHICSKCGDSGHNRHTCRQLNSNSSCIHTSSFQTLTHPIASLALY